MGMKKPGSLNALFWRFLIMLILGLAGGFAIPFAIMLLSVALGYITSADSSEQSAEYISPVIMAAPDLSAVRLPLGLDFVIMDKNYNVLETTLDRTDLDMAMEYALYGKKENGPDKQYKLIKRENEYVILQYYIGSQFLDRHLKEYLPSPEKLLYIVICINCITVCIILTGSFSKSLRCQLNPLFEATSQISDRNLDFDVGHSNIKEFEEALCSFSNMKESLKASLKKQWQSEQLQKEQIAALAHDLKTPLTIISGNAELLNETSLDEEQKTYIQYITDSSKQMQFFIRTLIEISRASAGYKIQRTSMEFLTFTDRLKEQIEILCNTKTINLSWNIFSDCDMLEADFMLLERAVMNVISNALEYSPDNGTVYIKIQYTKGRLKICVTDEGKGFSKEALKHAREQFFMDNAGRNSTMHYGMGLYIVNSIVSQHNGQLIMENDEITKGARVTMIINI